MIDPDVQRLVRMAVAGDYVALLPLMDRLEELEDRRHRAVFETVGDAYQHIFATEHERDVGDQWVRQRGPRYSYLIRERLANLFWPELAPGGPAALLKKIAEDALEWVEYMKTTDYLQNYGPTPPPQADPAVTMDSLLAALTPPTEAP